jgi:hypothetical protein
VRRDLSIDELGDLVTEPHMAVLATHREARDGSVIIRLEPRPGELRAWDYADEF